MLGQMTWLDCKKYTCRQKIALSQVGPAVPDVDSE